MNPTAKTLHQDMQIAVQGIDEREGRHCYFTI